MTDRVRYPIAHATMARRFRQDGVSVAELGETLRDWGVYPKDGRARYSQREVREMLRLVRSVEELA